MTTFPNVTRSTVAQCLRLTMGSLLLLPMLPTQALLSSSAMLVSHSQVATLWSPSHVWRTDHGVLFQTAKVRLSNCILYPKSDACTIDRLENVLSHAVSAYHTILSQCHQFVIVTSFGAPLNMVGLPQPNQQVSLLFLIYSISRSIQVPSSSRS